MLEDPVLVWALWIFSGFAIILGSIVLFSSRGFKRFIIRVMESLIGRIYSFFIRIKKSFTHSTYKDFCKLFLLIAIINVTAIFIFAGINQIQFVSATHNSCEARLPCDSIKTRTTDYSLDVITVSCKCLNGVNKTVRLTKMEEI